MIGRGGRQCVSEPMALQLPKLTQWSSWKAEKKLCGLFGVLKKKEEEKSWMADGSGFSARTNSKINQSLGDTLTATEVKLRCKTASESPNIQRTEQTSMLPVWHLLTHNPSFPWLIFLSPWSWERLMWLALIWSQGEGPRNISTVIPPRLLFKLSLLSSSIQRDGSSRWN